MFRESDPDLGNVEAKRRQIEVQRVDDAVIVDAKVAGCFTDTHVAQMVRYLNITGLDLALLLNFKNAQLEWKRVLRPREPAEHDTPDLHA